MERLAIDHSVTPPSIGGSPVDAGGSPSFDGGYSPASLDGAAALISPDEVQEMDFCRSPRASFGSRRSS